MTGDDTHTNLQEPLINNRVNRVTKVLSVHWRFYSPICDVHADEDGAKTTKA